MIAAADLPPCVDHLVFCIAAPYEAVYDRFDPITERLFGPPETPSQPTEVVRGVKIQNLRLTPIMVTTRGLPFVDDGSVRLFYAKFCQTNIRCRYYWGLGRQTADLQMIGLAGLSVTTPDEAALKLAEENIWAQAHIDTKRTKRIALSRFTVKLSSDAQIDFCDLNAGEQPKRVCEDYYKVLRDVEAMKERIHKIPTESLGKWK